MRDFDPANKMNNDESTILYWGVVPYNGVALVSDAHEAVQFVSIDRQLFQNSQKIPALVRTRSLYTALT